MNRPSNATDEIRNGLVQLGIADEKTARVVSIRPFASGLFQTYLVTPDEIVVKAVSSKDMAEAELDGLHSLSSAGARTPKIFGLYSTEKLHFIFMSRFSGRPQTAHSLKVLYSKTREFWGYTRDNYIGSLHQTNSRRETFDEFWWLDRIEPQLRLGVQSGLLGAADLLNAEKLVAHRSHQWDLNACGPRMIHGDLWSGNLLADASGEVVVIDPSVSFAHPEQDLAMLELFGSPLSNATCDSIAASIGLSEDRAERVPFFQLYPLLVHVNLFGSSYVNGVRQVIRRYG